MPKATKRDKYELAWSIDENSVFLTDTDEDQPVLTITFAGQTARLTTERKLDILQEIVNGLRQSITIQKTTLGY